MALKKLLGLMLVCCSIAAAGANGAPPKFLKKAAKALDESDPVQVAIYQVLDSYPTFEAVLGPAYSDQEQQAFIDMGLAGLDLNDKNMMARLQNLEAMASTLRHMKVEIEGAEEGQYHEQNTVSQASTIHVTSITWRFLVPSDELENTARRLILSVEELLGKDRRWKDTSDSNEQHPTYATVSYTMRYDLTSFLSQSTKTIMVKVTYMYLRNPEGILV